MAAAPIISVQGISKGWMAGNRHIQVIRNMSLDVYLGESLALVGPSGAGKSTLLHLLGLLTPPDQGSISFAGVSARGSQAKWSTELRRKIGLVFQSPKLLPNLNVVQNVRIPLMHRGVPMGAQKRMAHEALEQVGLSHRLKHRPDQLSGGERMRAALARALVCRPVMLLADEPTGTLDSKTGDKVADLLFNMVNPERALVIVTHQMRQARRADRIIQIVDGEIRQSGESSAAR